MGTGRLLTYHWDHLYLRIRRGLQSPYLSSQQERSLLRFDSSIQQLPRMTRASGRM
jgi:hypothetical protein